MTALVGSGRPVLGQGTRHDSTTSGRTTGFVVARYVEDGTRSIYGAQRLDRVMVLGGLLRNSRTDITTAVLICREILTSGGDDSTAHRFDADRRCCWLEVTAVSGDRLDKDSLPAFPSAQLASHDVFSAYGPILIIRRHRALAEHWMQTCGDEAGARDDSRL